MTTDGEFGRTSSNWREVSWLGRDWTTLARQSGQARTQLASLRVFADSYSRSACDARPRSSVFEGASLFDAIAAGWNGWMAAAAEDVYRRPRAAAASSSIKNPEDESLSHSYRRRLVEREAAHEWATSATLPAPAGAGKTRRKGISTADRKDDAKAWALSENVSCSPAALFRCILAAIGGQLEPACELGSIVFSYVASDCFLMDSDVRRLLADSLYVPGALKSFRFFTFRPIADSCPIADLRTFIEADSYKGETASLWALIQHPRFVREELGFLVVRCQQAPFGHGIQCDLIRGPATQRVLLLSHSDNAFRLLSLVTTVLSRDDGTTPAAGARVNRGHSRKVLLASVIALDSLPSWMFNQ